MHTKLFVLPALCLGGAALLLVPARTSQAFSKIGGSLSEDQRDVRVFDNFLDATANNNTTPSSQFPAGSGPSSRSGRASIEWSSTLHGDGTGDPQGGNLLGSGGANFDPMWAGTRGGVGGTNDNIVSRIATCGGGGTLAFTETPISNGWRIRVLRRVDLGRRPGHDQRALRHAGRAVPRVRARARPRALDRQRRDDVPLGQRRLDRHPLDRARRHRRRAVRLRRGLGHQARHHRHGRGRRNLDDLRHELRRHRQRGVVHECGPRPWSAPIRSCASRA
jgi:hypothetical protein